MPLSAPPKAEDLRWLDNLSICQVQVKNTYVCTRAFLYRKELPAFLIVAGRFSRYICIPLVRKSKGKILSQYLFSVFFHLDFFRCNNTLHFTFFIDDECGAESSHVFSAAHALLTPYAKGIV